MKIQIYQVDAFTDKLFGGNPAGVCPLDEWIPDDIMQKIAMENNLSETAFIVERFNDYEIRWFTPSTEVDLCGHATLAAAHVIFNHLDYADRKITFFSKSGILGVKKDNGQLTLNFPRDSYEKVPVENELYKGFGLKPIEAYKGKSDYMLVYSSQKEIEDIKPDFRLINDAVARGVIITAKGDNVDFVSRFFAPQSGVLEDPVTGSAHTTLTPYWAEKLGKNELTAMQLSRRKGKLKCKLLEDRVEIAGEATTYMTGHIEI